MFFSALHPTLFFLYTFIIFAICLNFMKQNQQLIFLLLFLEALMILNMNFLIFSSKFFSSSIYMVFTFLTLAVCEASVGLSLLISLARDSGNAYL